MHAQGNGHNVCWVSVEDVSISYFDKGLYLQCEDAGNSAAQWVNGNQFDRIRFSQNKHDIYLDGSAGTPNETSGNIFRDIQSQPAKNTRYFTISGMHNRVSGMFWDAHNIESGIKSELTIRATYNVIDTNLLPSQISDMTQYYNQIKSGQYDTNSVIAPATTGAQTFTGNQDDFLAFADKRFTVTQVSDSGSASIPAPISGTLNNVFKPDASFVKWNMSNVSEQNPITILIEFSNTVTNLANFGISFGPYKESPSFIQIERYTGGSWLTIVKQAGMGVQNTFIQRQMYTNIDKLRIKLYGTNDETNNALRIYRIFGQSTSNPGSTYIQANGGRFYGDVSMGNNYFVIGNKAQLPVASEVYRGNIIMVHGGEGTGDSPYICIKDISSNYVWKKVCLTGAN